MLSPDNNNSKTSTGKSFFFEVQVCLKDAMTGSDEHRNLFKMSSFAIHLEAFRA